MAYSNKMTNKSNFKQNPLTAFEKGLSDRNQRTRGPFSTIVENSTNSGTADEGEQVLEDSTITQPLRLYQQSATIHGVSMLSAPQLYFFRRFLWTALVTVMAVVLAWTLYKQITELNQYPIKTVMKSPLYHQLAFPAVTICNVNQYIRGRVPDDPMIRNVIYYKSEYAKLVKAYRPVPNFDDLTDVDGEEVSLGLLNASIRLDELLISCTWGFSSYDCKDLFEPVNTSYGQCFVFNKNQNNPRLATMSGPRHGLRMRLDIKNTQGYYSQKIIAGIKVLVHQQHETVYPEEGGWYVRPGVAAELALTRTNYIRLPRPYKAFSNSYCEDIEAESYVSKLTRYSHYSYKSCQAHCLYDFLDNACGCRGYYEPGNLTLCTAKQFILCHAPAVARFGQRELKACACVEECNTIIYSGNLVYADFASQFIEDTAVKENLITPGYFRNSAIELDIFFQTLHVDYVEQTPELTMVTILATLGGEMGLFLGASLLSFVEILEILLLMVFRFLQSCSCRIFSSR